MRTRLIPYAGWFALALGGIGGTSCSNLDIGQERDAPGPLNVNHVILLDQTRGINPDLLNDDAEKRAAGQASQGRSCDFVDPCPPPVVCGELLFQGASSGIFASFPAAPGVCHDPENVQEVAPSVDSRIRVSFNKLLDNRVVDVAGQVVPTAVTVVDSQGTLVDADEVFYDRSGSPVYTSDPNILPYGPALVFTPSAPLRPGETYTVTVDPAVVVARNNQLPPLPEDLRFTFTVEGFFVLEEVNCPGISADPTICVLPPTLIQYRTSANGGTDPPLPAPANPVPLAYSFNADVDPASTGTVTVRDSNNTIIPVNVTADGRDLAVTRADGLAWPAGPNQTAATYSVTIAGWRAVDGGVTAPDFTSSFDVIDRR